MDKEELRKHYECRLKVLEKDYKSTMNLANALRDDINDITFDERVSDPQERYLLGEKLKTVEGVQTNMLNFIRFYRRKIKENEPEPWEEGNAIRTVETPCGPVRVVNTDKASKEELDGMIHHCGQDADEHQPENLTYKDLLGMKVICVGGSAMKCEDCSLDCDNCVKVELVGGDYICLAEPQQEESTTEIDDSPKSFEEAYRDSMNLLREFYIKQSEANQRLVKALKEESEELKKPFISFDEEESNVMVDIKDKTEAFMKDLDSVVNG